MRTRIAIQRTNPKRSGINGSALWTNDAPKECWGDSYTQTGVINIKRWEFALETAKLMAKQTENTRPRVWLRMPWSRSRWVRMRDLLIWEECLIGTRGNERKELKEMFGRWTYDRKTM